MTLQALALVAAVAGALGSLGLLLHAGQRAPVFLLVLFIGWDLSPFLALAWANIVAKRWPAVVGATLHGLTFVIALFSLAIYTNAVLLNPTAKTPTATFLLVPLGSWLLMAIVFPIAARVSRR